MIFRMKDKKTTGVSDMKEEHIEVCFSQEYKCLSCRKYFSCGKDKTKFVKDYCKEFFPDKRAMKELKDTDYFYKKGGK